MLASVVALTLLTVGLTAAVVVQHRRLRRVERDAQQTRQAVADAGEAIAILTTRRTGAGPGAVPPQRRRRHLRALPFILAGGAWVAHRAREHPALAATGAAATLAAGMATVPLLLGPEPGQLDLATPPSPPARTVGPPPTDGPAPTPTPVPEPATPDPQLPTPPAATVLPTTDAPELPPAPGLPGDDGGTGGNSGVALQPTTVPSLEPTPPPLPLPPAPTPAPAPLPSPPPSPPPDDEEDHEGDDEEDGEGLLCVEVRVEKLAAADEVCVP